MLIKLLKNLKKSLFLQTPSTLFFKKNNFFKKSINYNIVNFGKLNRNKIFYVIRRSPGTGLFSNVLFVLNHLLIAKKFNFIPIVDMKNFITVYNEKKTINGTNNAWEYYFEKLSKFDLEEVYKSNKVIFCDNKYHHHFIYDIDKNKKIISLFKNEIKIKSDLIKDFKKFKKKNFKGKVLGVHFRGTSYKRSPGHPFPATKKQMLNIVKRIMNKYNYSKIFLATEEKDYLDFFKTHFSSKLIFLKDVYRSNINDAFKKYPRKNHRYKLGREIILDTLLLSSAECFIYVNSNVSSAAIALNLNKRQKRFIIENGNNSKNEFFAQFLWYLKKNFPIIFGDFKNKIKYKSSTN